MKCFIEQQFLKLIIKDFGIGINVNEIEKIGQLFYRGTGIGLYMIKSILEAIKGNLFIESEENKFTQFTVEIPLL